MDKQGSTATYILTCRPFNQVSVEGRVLGDQVVSAIECFGDIKNYNGAGWFLLIVCEDLEKENYMLRALHSHSTSAKGA